ncbi:MAG: GGDEF domain-containing protein [Patescibacteria group bacterium]
MATKTASDLKRDLGQARREVKLLNALLKARDEEVERLKEETRKREEEVQKLIELAYVDVLTGLPRREPAFDHLRRELRDSFTAKNPRSEGATIGILYMDLVGFKRVNDEIGHDAGDNVLRCVGQILRTMIRPKDFAARWGGDEFLIMFPGARAEILQMIAERIFARILLIENSVSVRIGGIVYKGRSGITAELLIAAADRKERQLHSDGKTGILIEEYQEP